MSSGKSVIHRVNYLGSELQALYHQASVRYGISDSVSIVLYTINEEGTECLLSEIIKRSGISKQTVNSAIRGLEADGILYLEAHDGRSKKVVLTEKGNEFVGRTVAHIYEAEEAVFDSWEEEDIESYIRLQEKYIECLRRQFELEQLQNPERREHE